MKITLIETSLGILAVDEENKLIEKTFFSKQPQTAAEAMLKIESGKATDELTELINKLRKLGYETFVFENATLAEDVRKTLNVKAEVSRSSSAGETVRSSLERFAVESGFVKDADGFRLWTHNVAVEMAKLRVRRAIEKRDLLIAQAIQTLDDLDKTVNLFMGRVREWYGVHFPELDRLLEKHETYARLVLTLGGRDNFTEDKLEKEEVPKEKAQQIAKAAETSMGADLIEFDLKQVQALCQSILSLYELRQTLENYLDNVMEDVAPNTKALAGSLLGARLIAIAGGLTNLARRPSSTIQVLGAEKALFRSLKIGTRPPKHGLIFQHASLHDAKKWQRGKIARALAGKLAIAARSDAFGGRYIGEELKEDLERRMAEIREKYAEPPLLPAKRPKREKKRRRRGRERKG
jgi:nucleolar protein 56